MPDGSKQEALMALAGPATSLALGGLFLGGYVLLEGARSFNLRFAVFYLGVGGGLFLLCRRYGLERADMYTGGTSGS